MIESAGSAGLHVNSSLVKPGTSINLSHEVNHYSAFAMPHGAAKINANAANAANGILQVTADTPLWSFHNEDDIGRLVGGDGTPKTFTLGQEKEVGHVLNIRENGQPLQAHEASPLPLEEWATHAHLEERLPGARMDPHVAAFRTTLGTYHGLENPIHRGEDLLHVKKIQPHASGDYPLHVLPEGDSPEAMWKNYQNQHLREGGVTQKYVGDLYDAETLAAIDARARNPHILQHESSAFQWKPSAVGTKVETLPSEAIPHSAPPAAIPPADGSFFEGLGERVSRRLQGTNIEVPSPTVAVPSIPSSQAVHSAPEVAKPLEEAVTEAATVIHAAPTAAHEVAAAHIPPSVAAAEHSAVGGAEKAAAQAGSWVSRVWKHPAGKAGAIAGGILAVGAAGYWVMRSNSDNKNKSQDSVITR